MGKTSFCHSLGWTSLAILTLKYIVDRVVLVRVNTSVLMGKHLEIASSIKRLQFYKKVRAAVVSKAISKETKQKKRSRQKKLKAYDLSSLTECLPELITPSASEPAKLKLNCKRRNDLVLKESDKLKMVINHPVYQSDPLAAIYQHLELTQPAMEKKPKKKDGKTKKNKAKKKKSKATESMDM